MKILLLVLSLLGAGMCAGGLYMGYNSIMLLRHGTTATGTVIDNVMHKSTSTDSKTHQQKTTLFYNPVVSFTTESGQDITFTSDLGNGNQPSYEKGQQVEVIYFNDRPQDAKVKGGMELWLGSIVLLFMGGILIIVLPVSNRMFPPKEQQNMVSSLLPNFGKSVTASITNISQIESRLPASDSFSDSSSWIIEAQYTDPETGKIHRFKSKPIPKDPRGRLGETIQVKTLPGNYGVYEMETLALEK